MTPLEALEQELHNHNVPVVHNTLPYRLQGLYWSDTRARFIILSPDLGTSAERLCVLAEEAGHFHTSSGNILHLRRDKVLNRQQERRARAWAYKRLVPPEEIITAWLKHIRTPWELAEHFGVTEKFFHAAIVYYRCKHWPAWHVDRYVISFEPFEIKEIKEKGK
jgi:Zn-dependent peptidase ImmA (M78 family)